MMHLWIGQRTPGIGEHSVLVSHGCGFVCAVFIEY